MSEDDAEDEVDSRATTSRYHGGPTNVCDANGVDLTAHGCDCTHCACSGWDPPPSTYLHRFAPADGFSTTEQVCFERDRGHGEYVILVTDDRTTLPSSGRSRATW